VRQPFPRRVDVDDPAERVVRAKGADELGTSVFL
jgi:hypothetical protein